MGLFVTCHHNYQKFISQVSGKTFSFCGTSEYVPPEVVLKTGHGHSVDFWALGILIFELVEVDFIVMNCFES